MTVDSDPGRNSGGGEFELIARHFAPLRRQRPWLEASIGEDCALLRSAGADTSLALSVDMLIAGVHFPETGAAADIAWRALSVNLSDLAACGASPLAFTLALSLPSADEDWLQAFSRGLSECAEAFAIDLVGGDMSRGPLMITIQVIGQVPAGMALRRSAATPGDRLWVSGSLGDAAAGLRLCTAPGDTVELPQSRRLLQRFWRPAPRLALGGSLCGVAGAAIDISDGLLADAAHIAENSAVAIEIEAESLPLSEDLLAFAGRERALEMALRGGDDYELLFTAAPQNDAAVLQAAADSGVPCTTIGAVVAGSPQHAAVRCDGAPSGVSGGWDHFAQ